MKLLILGMKQSGKDTAAEYLNNRVGLKFMSSSLFFMRLPICKDLIKNKGYSSPEELFENRGKHRSELFDIICKYNEDSPIRLASEIFKQNDMYVGMRNKKEVEACKTRWPELLVIWIDAGSRGDLEDSSSCDIEKSQSHIIIDNSTTEIDFENRLEKLCGLLEYCNGDFK